MHAINDPSDVLDNPRHEKFAQLIASGIDAKAAYARVYRGVRGESAEQGGSRLSKTVKKRVRWLQSQSATATTLTMQERREFLARVTRARLDKLDLEKDGDLIQEIDYHDAESGGGLKKIKTPGKRECVMDDAKLAGEITNSGLAVNVNVGVAVGGQITESERAVMIQKKRESVERRLAARRAGGVTASA